jgi:hypothetical protein
MTLLHDNDRPDLENGVRTMLHRLAADVRERPPAWEDLIARPEPAGSYLGVVPGAGTSSSERRERRRGRARRPRTGVATAAAGVLLLALAGAVVVGRTGGEPTGSPATETIVAISPGDAGFDASAAAAVWATGIDDPAAATMAYLAAMGVPMDPAAPPALVLTTTTDTTAAVDWSLPGAPGGASGTVYLRAASAGGAPPTWTVAGAAASDVALADVRYDGSELSFTVARSSADAEQLAVGVWVDGHPVSLGGDAVAQAGAGDVSLGELLELGSAADAHDTLRLPVEADDIVTLRVVHVVDGTVRSVTQMAVALPDADPVLAAAGPPPVDAGGEATSTVEGDVDGASGTAEAGAGGSGGVDLVPDDVVPTLPELPGLPALPTVPGIPAPTLPTPPTTALGSITDRLP